MLFPPKGDCLAVRLDGRGPGGLSAALGPSLRGKLVSYRVGFMASFGHFRKHCRLPGVPEITFAQAYNAPAKCARPTDLTLFPAVVFARMLHRLPRYADVGTVALCLTNAFSRFFERYCYRRPILRVEEVVSVDAQTCRTSILDAMRELGVFSDAPIHTSSVLASKGLLVRLCGWSGYVRRAVGADVEFMRAFLEGDGLRRIGAEAVPIATIRRLFRAEYRLAYFAHGMNACMSYQTNRHMLMDGSEAESILDDVVRVRALHDRDDDYLFPIYAPLLPACLVEPIRCMWAVRNVLGEGAPFANIAIIACAVWAYTRALTDEVQVVQPNYESAARNMSEVAPECLFSAENFLLGAVAWRNDCTVSVASAACGARNIARKLLRAPTTAFAQSLVCLLSGDEESIVEAERVMEEYIADHASLFPVDIYQATKHTTWSLVALRTDSTQNRSRLREARQRLQSALHDIRTGRVRKKERARACGVEVDAILSRNASPAQSRQRGGRVSSSSSSSPPPPPPSQQLMPPPLFTPPSSAKRRPGRPPRRRRELPSSGQSSESTDSSATTGAASPSSWGESSASPSAGGASKVGRGRKIKRRQPPTVRPPPPPPRTPSGRRPGRPRGSRKDTSLPREPVTPVRRSTRIIAQTPEQRVRSAAMDELLAARSRRSDAQ